MKKVISLFLIAVLISGCNRTADNVSTALQSLNASAPVPQSQNAPALAPQSSNAPASELQPMPNLTEQSKLDVKYCIAHIDYMNELCGDLNAIPYFKHSTLSLVVNVILAYFAVYGGNLSKFFGILKMVSAFSFPVHVALTNLSFLSKSKISLASLAADTFLSVYSLITKKPPFNGHIVFLQHFLEIIRYFMYPHIGSSK